jgi:hypothetical protein
VQRIAVVQQQRLAAWVGLDAAHIVRLQLVQQAHQLPQLLLEVAAHRHKLEGFEALA